MVGSGEFRQDLWYRLAVFPIDLPPLRERKEDIPALARHFAQRAAHRFGLALKLPSESGLEALVEYDWPGNIRELAAVIDRAAILGDGRSLEVHAALGMATAGAPATTRGDSTDVVAHDEAAPRRTAPQGADTSDGFAAVGVDASAELAADELLPLDEVVRLHIERVVGAAGGRIEGAGGAAALLGMNPSTLRSKMRKLGIRR
jgi:transcriptional regulator with GAF, ATPase, and Fis domain